MKKRTGYIILYLAGVLVMAAGLFLPAKADAIVSGYEIPNMFNVLTSIGTAPLSDTAYIQMLFGHGDEIIGIAPIILSVLLLYLPVAVIAASIIMQFFMPESKLGLIFGIAGTAIVFGINLILLLTGTCYIGTYVAVAGVAISAIGILLLYFEGASYSGNDIDSDVVAGEITCMQGEHAGGVFRVPGTVIIGSNPRECNIVLRNKTVSRVHCKVKYIPETDTYTVTDLSSNGTFFTGGRPLVKNLEMQVNRGTEIYMGEPKESFYLD